MHFNLDRDSFKDTLLVHSLLSFIACLINSPEPTSALSAGSKIEKRALLIRGAGKGRKDQR
jgi:hypothetical protein